MDVYKWIIFHRHVSLLNGRADGERERDIMIYHGGIVEDGLLGCIGTILDY